MNNFLKNAHDIENFLHHKKMAGIRSAANYMRSFGYTLEEAIIVLGPKEVDFQKVCERMNFND